MFADSLLDSQWENRSRRGWTTLASFTVQALAVAIALALPLLYTQGLPQLHLVSLGAPAGPPPGRPPGESHAHAGHVRPIVVHGFFAPRSTPIGVEPDESKHIEEEAPECLGCVPGAIEAASRLNPVIDSIGTNPNVAPPPPPPTARPPRISRMMEGNLIYRVQPVYPPLARAARIQGTVELHAIISRTGTIENLTVTSGHPMLVDAAKDAVRQWRYRPYLLNGDPVEVETQVTVRFSLGGG
jgi:periplasmic protein TonB